MMHPPLIPTPPGQPAARLLLATLGGDRFSGKAIIVKLAYR